MALYSLLKLTVLCAIFQAAIAVRRQPHHRILFTVYGRVHLAGLYTTPCAGLCTSIQHFPRRQSLPTEPFLFRPG